MAEIVLVVVGAALLNVYAAALVLLRGPLFHTRVYRPMVLNIGLSLAPALIAVATIVVLLVVATMSPQPWLVWLVAILGGIAWLLALPNSAYLITELNLSHRREGESVPLWYDIVLVLSLAMSGVINSLVSVVLVQAAVVLIALPNDDSPLEGPLVWVSAAVLMTLTGFGIYLGRHLRFNSWDVVRPHRMVAKTARHFSQPGTVGTAAGFTLVHAIFLMCMYLVVVAPAIGLLG
ncbi:DUF1361 domain-containing protein [Demequina sp. NBRC 110056]|uniref:DUF1361 domain-containing protein n=1 Tax=Demequina sp. NBRC 110056 TaxID=1570345 RepID=UPI000A030A20|nr:DUF1361 domain-containing protein [Demequina sp. NBRC 110056]